MKAVGRLLPLALGATLLFSASPEALPATAPQALYEAAADALIEKGHAARAAEDYYAALTAFESALVADPSNVEALVAIGETHEALGKPAVGLSYYRRALVVEPNHRAALKHESLVLIAEGKVAKAEANLERLKLICGDTGCTELADIRKAIAAYKAEKSSVAAADPKSAPDSGGS